jgi:YidC/Oxa1 family membrane protein insertase
MDTKRLATALAVGLGLILLYLGGLRLLDKKMGWDHLPAAPAADTAQSQPTATQPALATEPSQVVSSQPTSTGTTRTADSQPSVKAGIADAHVVPAPGGSAIPSDLGSAAKDGPFTLELKTEPIGAGIQSVILNQFKRTAEGKDPYVFQQPVENLLDMAAMGSRTLTVDGKTYDLSGLNWTIVSSEPNAVVYGADLVKDSASLVKLRKRFEVKPRTSDSEGYEIGVSLTFENATQNPMTIKTAFNGPTLPPVETTRPPDRQVVAGVKADDAISLDAHPIEEFKGDKLEIDLTKDSKGRPAQWAGAESNYFGAIVLPEKMIGGNGSDNYIARILARGYNIDKDKPTEEHQAFLIFETGDIKLDADKSVTLPMSVYVGPKWRKVLDAAHYTSPPRAYNQLLAVRSSMCGISICTFGWLVSGIIGLLSGLQHYVLRDWGLAIIGLVAIVRILLHPITKRSQISMAKMGKMGPEMKRLQEKYKDDKESLNKAMVDFHRQQGLGPYLGCLPMFLQMPIWIALYGVLQSTFELRHAPFLWNLTWIHDLSQPDYLVKFDHPISLPFITLQGINLLPVFLAGVMVLQQQFMPKPVAATPEQEQQQKMMKWISPIMFLFIFYNMASGLNLYIFTSTAVGVIESKIIRDHLKAREEAEKAGRVFVETKPTRGSRQGKTTTTLPDRPTRRGLVGFFTSRWEKLIEQAEQVRRDQDRGGKKKA